jgi:hypothetical protein
MQLHSMARGVRATIVLLSAAGTLVAATVASASPAFAASNAAAGAAGSLWEAGGERSDPDRFFRMNTDGTIDRSTAFPAPGGSTLHADGTLAVSIDGALWASATTSSGNEYLVRFVPSPDAVTRLSEPR